MKSQILAKINNFIKKRLIEFLGIVLMLFSFFLLASIITYSPSDPNFIYSSENTEIKNIGGFYGSVVSDFLLQSIGLISILLTVNFFYWGLKIVSEKIINNFITKIFFIFIYIISGTLVLNSSYNDSFWLIDNGNGGFVGRALRENIYYFSSLIENQYLLYFLSLLSIVFFILSLGIKRSEIIKLLLFPFTLIKKIYNFFVKSKEKLDPSKNFSAAHYEPQNLTENSNKNDQPFLPFSQKKDKEVKSQKSVFKIPGINFLEKNIDLKNKKDVEDPELTKNSELIVENVNINPSRIAFGHIISQNWSRAFTYLLSSVHHPDNLYLTCSKCNSSLGDRFPASDLRSKITKIGTIGDWLRKNEKEIRKS